MGLLKKVRLELAKMLITNFASVETNNGVLFYDGDEINVGDEVFIRNADGELEVPADGEYETETRVIVVSGGVVESILDKDGGESGGGSDGGDMSGVTQKEFSALMSLVYDLAKEQEKNWAEFSSFKAEFQKFRKEPAEKSANEKVTVKDVGNSRTDQFLAD